MNNGHSGFREWCETHQDCLDEDFAIAYAQCKSQFDYDKFVAYYDGLSDTDWQVVIQEALSLGYDIRSVLCYKQEQGSDFTVDTLPEIMDTLLCMDGSSAFGYMSDIVYDCSTSMKEKIENDYARWELPIPEYWMVRLWT